MTLVTGRELTRTGDAERERERERDRMACACACRGEYTAIATSIAQLVCDLRSDGERSGSII